MSDSFPPTGWLAGDIAIDGSYVFREGAWWVRRWAVERMDQAAASQEANADNARSGPSSGATGWGSPSGVLGQERNEHGEQLAGAVERNDVAAVRNYVAGQVVRDGP